MKKKVIAMVMVITILTAFLLPLSKAFTKPVKAGECTITCEKCYLPDGSVGGQDWTGHYELGPWGWYCKKDYQQTPCSNFC